MRLRLIPPLVLLLALLIDSSGRAATPTTIRVGILREQERAAVMSDRPIEVWSGSQRALLEPAAYELVPGASGIEVGDGLGALEGPVRMIPAPGARLYVGVKPYRGVIEVRRTPSGRLTVINELEVEEYLYGVLRMEVDPRWPGEALKAQAIAARTLALYSLGRYQAEGYDVRATTDSQVYGGIAAEDPRTTAAVDETRGILMTYQGRPIFAAYHSDSGGTTESSEYVWGGRYAYLRSVQDPFAPAVRWTARLDLTTFEDRLRRAGRPVTSVVAVEIMEVTPSGRAGTVRIVSASGSVLLKGTELRSLLGADVLRSTLFAVRVYADEPAAVEFVGRGSGHGVGLSQWGARGQALLGRNAAEILRYYYAGVTIESQ